MVGDKEVGWTKPHGVEETLYRPIPNADTAVPISRLADIIEDTHRVIAKAGLAGWTLGHVGDGGFSNPFGDVLEV